MRSARDLRTLTIIVVATTNVVQDCHADRESRFALMFRCSVIDLSSRLEWSFRNLQPQPFF